MFSQAVRTHVLLQYAACLISNYLLCGWSGIDHFRQILPWSILLIKACTQRPIFTGSTAELVVESGDSNPESADSNTGFVIVGRLPVLNMFNISTPIQLADPS